MLVKMYSLLSDVNLFISRLRYTQDLQWTAVLFYFFPAFPMPNTEPTNSLKDSSTQQLDLLSMEIRKCTYLSEVSLFLTNMKIITTGPLFIFSRIPSPPSPRKLLSVSSSHFCNNWNSQNVKLVCSLSGGVRLREVTL